MIVWSAGELAVTMVCIGIPVLRPLYRRIRYNTDYSSDRYYKHGQGSDGTPVASYGLSNLDKQSDGKRNFDPLHTTSNEASNVSAVTYIGNENNRSDEEILGPDFHNAAAVDGHRKKASSDVERGELRQPEQLHTP